MEPCGGRQKVWRTSTHPVRSRIQSRGVVRCRSVFRAADRTRRPRTRLTVHPSQGFRQSFAADNPALSFTSSPAGVLRAGLLPRAHSVIRSVRISSSVSGYCEVGSTTLVISLDLPVRYSVRPAKTYIYLAGRSPGHRPQEPALHGLDRMQKRPVSLKKG